MYIFSPLKQISADLKTIVFQPFYHIPVESKIITSMYFHLSIRSTTNHWNSHLTKRQRRSTGTHTLPGQQNCCRTAEITLNWEKTNVGKLKVDYVDNTIGLLANISSLPYLISQKKSGTPTSPCQGNRTLRLASSVTSTTCCDQFWTNRKYHILIDVK